MKWPENQTNFERNLAIVIGIDNYENSSGIAHLSTPVRDAEDFATLLEQKFDYQSQSEKVLRLFNKQATLSELRTLLTDTLPNVLKPTDKDRLIFYFAGHGIATPSDQGPKGYLIPQDAKPNNTDSYLSMDEVREALNKLQCHHLLVILDSCFAGAFNWAGTRKANVHLETIRREHYDRYIRYPAWQLITSSAHDQEALDVATQDDLNILSQDRRGIVDNNHSPFALALLEAFQNGDLYQEGKRFQRTDYTKDGVITASELIVYLEDRVAQLSKEAQNPRLYPLRREYDRGEFIFVDPGFDPNTLQPAPELNPENNPYRGLKPFEERHAKFFFGRDELVKKLTDRLTQSTCPLITVLGASGCGKSSLVKAGLLPHLRKNQENKEQGQRWYILEPMRPGNSPFKELARTFLPIANNDLIPQLDQVKFLDSTFTQILDPNSQQNPTRSSSREEPLNDEAFDPIQLAQCWLGDQPEAKLLLIIDYFRQLQDLCKSQDQATLSQLYNEIKSTLDPLTDALEQQPEYFSNLITTWSQKNPKTKLLLVIDQFEELITMNEDKNQGISEPSNSPDDDEQKQWQRFLSLLESPLKQHHQQLQVVLTLRSDFEPQFSNSALEAYWESAKFPVSSREPFKLQQAIEEPARIQALYFEPPELVDQLIEDVRNKPGALPLLSFTLSELYIKLYKDWVANQSTGRALLQSYYDELGGVLGALSRRATEEYDNLVQDFGTESGKAYQATMQRIMLRMVTIEMGTTPSGQRVFKEELVYELPEENQRVEEIIKRLVKARLLVQGHEEKRSYIEFAHDFLIQRWDQLKGWIEQEKNNLALQQRLTSATNDWRQEQSPLWTEEGTRLIKLKQVIKSDNNWLNELETDFVKQSIKQKRERLEETEKQRDEALEGQINALSALSQVRFPEDQLGALIQILKAARITQQLIKSNSPWITADLSIRTQVVLRQTLSKIKEFNRLKNNEFPLNSFGELTFTSNSSILLVDNQGRGLPLNAIWQNELILMQDSQGLRLWQIDGSLVHHIPNLPLVKLTSNGQVAHFIYKSSQPQQQRKLNAIRLVNQQGQEVIFQENENEVLMTFALSPNGKLIAFGGWYGALYIWTTDGQKVKQEQILLGSLNSIDFSPNSEMLATGGKDGKIRLLTQNGDLLKTIEAHRDAIWGVCFSPDGETFASVSTDTTVKIWNTEGILQTTLHGHTNVVRAVCFNSDGQILASAGDDGTLRLWKPRGTEVLKSLDDHHTGSVYAVRFNPKQPMIATTSGQGQLILWNPDGSVLRIPEVAHFGTITALDFSPNGKMFVTAAGDREVKLWRLDDIENQQDFRGQNLGNHTGEAHLPIPFSVSFSPDNQTILLGSGTLGRRGFLELCDAETRQCQVIAEYDAQVLAVCFSPDGQMFAVGKRDKSVELWRQKENGFEPLRPIVTHNDLVVAVCFSPDGKFLASGSYDRTAKLWEINQFFNGASTVTPIILNGHTDRITAIRFSPNNQLIATASYDRTVKLWNIDGKLQKTLHGHTEQINALDFSPDGQILASASHDKTAILWNLSLELSLEQLINYGCEWIEGYLMNNPNITESDRQVLSLNKYPILNYDSQQWIFDDT